MLYMIKKQVVLIVLDGWGYSKEIKGNAIAQAKKPVFDSLWSTCPHALLKASGEAVGLPAGQMGNSEVGHMTIGAGKALDQDLVRINKAISSGEFSKNEQFKELFKHVKENNSTLHVMGLLSPGGIHSDVNHLFAFLSVAKENGIQDVAIDVFTDGRDTPPESAVEFVKELKKKNEEIGLGRISTISGRYYAMDRDHNWDRLQKVEDAIFEAKGNLCDEDPVACIENCYKREENDEHIIPIVCKDKDGNTHQVKKGDGIFFFNFRADRARMLSSKIIERKEKENLSFVTMTDYGEDYQNCLIAFPPIHPETTIAKIVSEAGMNQVHVAETQKFAHATYFLNGGSEEVFPGEEDILVPSRKDIPTYDLAPKMSAPEITEKVVEQIKKGIDFIFVNYANTDMVGHTAKMKAVIEAVEEVDIDLGLILEALKETGGVACITADHGNAEMNIDLKTGLPHTAHTTNPVPFILTDEKYKIKEKGTLADITPTILDLYGLEEPKSMTGRSLIIG